MRVFWLATMAIALRESCALGFGSLSGLLHESYFKGALYPVIQCPISNVSDIPAYYMSAMLSVCILLYH